MILCEIEVVLKQARKREGKKRGRERSPLPFPGKGTENQRGQGEGMKIYRLGMKGKVFLELGEEGNDS